MTTSIIDTPMDGHVKRWFPTMVESRVSLARLVGNATKKWERAALRVRVRVKAFQREEMVELATNHGSFLQL